MREGFRGLDLALGVAKRLRRPRSRLRSDGNAGGPARVGFWPDDDVDVTIESGQKGHETFNGKPFKLIVRKGGDFRLTYLEPAGSGNLGEFAVFDNLIYRDSQTHFRLFFRGVRQT